MAADVAEYVLQTLRVTSAVTDLVMGGADGIFESGDLDMKHLAQIEADRRDAGNPGRVLAIIVQDAGEEALDKRRHKQRVAVWLYDRQRGYTNIRTVRRQVYLALQGRSSGLDDPYMGRSAMIQLLFQNRTGHRHEHRAAVDFETVTFTSEVHLDMP